MADRYDESLDQREGIDRAAFLKRAGLLGAATAVGSWGSVGGLASASAAERRAEAAGSSSQMVVAGADVIGSTLDPQGYATYSEPASLCLTVLYDTLVTQAIPPTFAGAKTAFKTGGKYLPRLASSWKSSADGTKWTFKLNQKATSNFGNHLTAEDVAWTMKRAMANSSSVPAYYLTSADVKSVTALSADVVEFQLGKPGPPYFLGLLAQMPLGIIDSVQAKKYATTSDPYATSWLNSNIAGFGPYEWAGFNADGGGTLHARTDYISKPHISKIVQLAVPESSNRLELVLSGTADFTDQLSPSQLQTLRQAGKVGTYIAGVYAAQAFLAMDGSLPQFATPALRQAIAKTIPFKELLADVYLGKGLQWKTPIDPWFQGATDKYWNYTLDPSAAQSVFATLPSSAKAFPLSYAAGDQLGEQIAVLIADSLNAVGLNVSPTGVPPASFSQKRISGGLTSWIDDESGCTPESSLEMLQTFYSSTGLLGGAYHYTNDKLIDSYCQKILAAKSPAASLKLIDAAQKQLIQDLPVIPLVYTGTAAGYTPKLSGVQQSVWGNFDYRFFKLA
jgi:peptide/nickel transport system substrate-binding protein